MTRIVGIGAIALALGLGSPAAMARIFGANALTAPASRLSPQAAAATPLARIECRSGHGETTASVAFPIGSPRSMLADGAALRIDDPATAAKACKAIFYDAAGAPAESIAISGGRRLNSALLLTLQRGPSRSAGDVAALPRATAAALDGKTVQMITLMPAGPGRFVKVRSGGRAYAIPERHAARSDAAGRVLMATDYDSVSATRGSPVFDEAGRIVGAHHGAYCPLGASFDRDSCFNTFVLLDGGMAG